VLVCASALSDTDDGHRRAGSHTLPSAAGGSSGPASPEHTPRLALQGVRPAAGAHGHGGGPGEASSHTHTSAQTLVKAKQEQNSTAHRFQNTYNNHKPKFCI